MIASADRLAVRYLWGDPRARQISPVNTEITETLTPVENTEKTLHSTRIVIVATAAVGICLVMPMSASQSTGTITGTVTTSSAAPPPARVTIDQGVCGNEIADEAIVRDSAGRVANAVLTLAGIKGPGNPAAAGVMNEKCRFSPHVQLVRPNATITTSSSDKMLHTTNAQTAAGKVLFNVGLPLPGIKITKPVAGAGVVRLNCNTHPWMRGWIVVTDEIAAVSGADGTFVLTNVPAGTFELRVWHEALKGAPQKVTVAAGQTTAITVTLQ